MANCLVEKTFGNSSAQIKVNAAEEEKFLYSTTKVTTGDAAFRI